MGPGTNDRFIGSGIVCCNCRKLSFRSSRSTNLDDLEDFEFAVAKRFPKAFSPRHATMLATPRELADYLAARSEPVGDERSIKQHAFYSVRAVLASQLNRNREEIRPRTQLRDLMPDLQGRRVDWNAISAALRVTHFPRLHRPSGLVWSITLVVAVLSLVAILIAGFALGGSSAVLIIGLTTGALLSAVLLRATEQHATLFAPPTLTVGDLAAYATAYGTKAPGISIRPSTRSQYLEIVRDLVRLEIGARKIHDDATWRELLSSARSASWR